MDWHDFLDYLRTLKTSGEGIVSDVDEGEIELHVGRDSCTLTGRDVRHFLSSPSNVDLAFKALGSPSDSGVILTDVEVSDEVFEALEIRFQYAEYA